MKDDIVKARKEHVCEACKGVIRKGQLYRRIKEKQPRYDADDNQIGIEYYQDKLHDYDCTGSWLTGCTIKVAKDILQKCRKGDHEYVQESEQVSAWIEDGFVETDYCSCKRCGHRVKAKIVSRDELCNHCQEHIIEGSACTQHFMCEGSFCDKAKESMQDDSEIKLIFED